LNALSADGDHEWLIERQPKNSGCVNQRGTKPSNAANGGRAAATFAPKHIDDRHIQGLMVIVVGLGDEDGELLTSAGEYESLPSE